MTCHDFQIHTRKDKTNFFLAHEHIWDTYRVGEGYPSLNNLIGNNKATVSCQLQLLVLKKPRKTPFKKGYQSIII